jgi:hypothetical protein
MNRYRTIATLVGICFLLSNVTFMTGAVGFLEPVLGAPDVLGAASANRAQVVTGALLELVNGVFYLGIAALMFPILRKRAEALAIGYLAFRIIEFVMQVLAELSPLSLLSMSEAAAQAGGSGASSYQAVATLLLANRAGAFQMISIFLASGAFILYPALYQMRLVPRFVSVWGFVGAAGVLVTAVLEMLGVNPGAFGNVGLLMLLNELFLGVWLIVKGFRQPTTVAEATAIAGSAA